nr:hypothetical protein [Tanacetum cinerariifolium]
MPSSSLRWTVQNQSINVAISPVCASSESSGGDERIDQEGSGVAGRSSSKGFHQFCLKFIVGIWPFPMFSSAESYACSSKAISSSISRPAGVNEIDGPSLMSVVWMKVEVVMVALRTIQKLQELPKLRMVPLVVEEEVADEMETQLHVVFMRLVGFGFPHALVKDLFHVSLQDGVTRLKKYRKLSSAEATQADCDVKATNIILQALPTEIYALISTHKVAKDLSEQIQMLMQGTSLT